MLNNACFTLFFLNGFWTERVAVFCGIAMQNGRTGESLAKLGLGFSANRARIQRLN